MKSKRVGLSSLGPVVVVALAAGLVGCSSSGSTEPVDASVVVTMPSAPAPADDVPVEDAPIEDVPAEVDESSTSPAFDEALEAAIIEFVGDADGGVEVLIERNGVVSNAAGGVGSNLGEALEPGRSFRVGSVSKPFVSVMVQQMAEEGAVDLDAPLGDYLPDTTVGAEATIRQLLSHQSGIANYTDQPAFFAEVLTDLSRNIAPGEVLGYIDGVDAGAVDRFAYSNTNYILLGQLIEHIDGTDLNTSLAARITGPLGLESTYFDTGTEPLPADLVGGWSPLGGVGDPAAPYSAIASSAWAAGSLISTAPDLAAFLDGVVSGELISAASLAAMTDFGPAGYGLGAFQAAFSAVSTGFGHGGAIPGYSSTMAIVPDSGDTLVILTTNDALLADALAPDVLTLS